MHRGYIKMWRASVDNKLYFLEPFTKWQAWCDLLILANHKDNTVSIRGNIINVPSGSVLAGEEFLAKRWKWSRNKVRRFQSYLSSKTIQQTTQQKSRLCTIISIENWSHYQSTEQQTIQQKVQQKNIPKNDKNVKNTPLTPQGGNEEALKNVEERPRDRALQPEPIKAPRARARSQATAVQEDITAPLRTEVSHLARAVVTKATTGVGVSKKTRAALLEWVDYLTDQGKRINAQSIRKFVDVMGNNEHRITTTVDNSICNGYKSLIEPKKLTGTKGKVKEKTKFVMSKEAQALQNF